MAGKLVVTREGAKRRGQGGGRWSRVTTRSGVSRSRKTGEVRSYKGERKRSVLRNGKNLHKILWGKKLLKVTQAGGWDTQTLL